MNANSKPVAVEQLKPDAVIISHPHQDHYGLIERLDQSIPVYLSELGSRLIDASRIFSRQPPLDNDLLFFYPWKTFEVGSFKVTPYLMDHSSPDAFAFLAEAGQTRVLYSGDFRAHGKKGVLFERYIQKPPPNIDLLLMEGTMLDRRSSDFPDERAVEEEIVRVLLDQHNTSFIICSSQNIDRLVSAFRACKRTGKTLIIDVYTAWILEQMKLVTERVPNMFWDEVKVYVPNSQYQVVKENPDYFGDFRRAIFNPDNRIEVQQIESSPADFLQVIRLPGVNAVERYISDEPINIIYSQWLGYMERGDEGRYGAKELSWLREGPRVNFVYAHTSGHAALEDLKRYAEAVNPKMLVPIHTECRNEFRNHFDNVLVLEDEQELVL